MARRATVDLVVDRHAHLLQDFQFIGLDLSGATLSMHIRLYPEAPGAPLDTIVQNNLLTPGIGLRYTIQDTVAVLVASGALDAVPSGVGQDEILRVSTVSVWWANAFSMPQPAERGEDLVLAYDIKASSTTPLILPSILVGGKLTIQAGVTT